MDPGGAERAAKQFQGQRGGEAQGEKDCGPSRESTSLQRVSG